MISLKVQGMTCDHCEGAVEKALKAVPGVEKVVRVDRDREEVLVEGRPDPQALVAAVEEEGYAASVSQG